jgi:peptidoglycan hydrolase-like amidase
LRLLQLKGNTGTALAAAVAVVVGLAMACRTVPRRPLPPPEKPFSVGTFVASPSVRIGLVTGGRGAVVSAAEGGVVVWPAKDDGSRRAVPLPVASFRPAPKPAVGVRLSENGDETTSAFVVPATRDDTLSLDGVAYRGVLEIRGDEGGLTVVNLVNVEDYLRGVVPNELSPLAFPQLEALKAQAVAARTYALRNRGKFDEKGYDLCATSACQVYKGKSSEHPVSDQAVEATRGIVATYEGAPIEAFYTSTCGGHTEDAQNVFEGEGAPYLQGVVCAPEKTAWSLLRSTAPTRSLGDEESLSRNAALLVASRVIEARPDMATFLKAPATDAELKTWTARLLTVAKRKGCETAFAPPLSRRGTFFRYLVGSVCWDERAKRLLSPGDTDYLVHVEDRQDLGPDESVSAALLIQEDVLTPFPDNTLEAARVITRARAVGLLARVLEKLGSPSLVKGDFQGSEGDQVRVAANGRTDLYVLDPQARLFRTFDRAGAAASELSLAVGDPVSLVAQGKRIVFLEAELSRMGESADRASRYFRWEVRMTPADVARSIARYGDVGAVKDVVPRRIGVSGRVVDLAVVGSDGELLLKGMKIRFALGLRENLFVIDRELGDDGQVAQFVFTGKGWGHGVGLCQVGAYGMARTGSTYSQILAHYYPGTSLARSY